MDQETHVYRLISSLYQSALDDRLWEGFLNDCAEELHADAGIALASNNASTGESVVLASGRMDPAFLQAYKTYYGSINVYVKQAKHRIRLGVVQPGEALLESREVELSEYFNDFMRPQCIYYSLGVGLVEEGPALIHLGAVRSRKAGAFGTYENNLLTLLAPHVQTAARLRLRFLNLAARGDGVIQLLDKLPFGVFLLDASGHVLELNRRAREILAHGDGLLLFGSELRAARQCETVELKRLINAAAQTGSGQGIGAGGAMRVSRSSGGRDYCLLSTPLPQESAALGPTRPAAAVFVSDPDLDDEPQNAMLQRLFGLTKAEARVATILVGGDTIEGAAQMLQITPGTVRIHLKRIFLKTDTRRQAELVRLVLNSPAKLLS